MHLSTQNYGLSASAPMGAVGLMPPTRGGSSGSVGAARSFGFIPSVVEQAGLGRFVYLFGRSGKRYIFSAITGAQVSMYRNAVFAGQATDGAPVEFLADIASPDLFAKLYVHLFSEGDDGDRQDVLDDLA